MRISLMVRPRVAFLEVKPVGVSFTGRGTEALRVRVVVTRSGASNSTVVESNFRNAIRVCAKRTMSHS
jgi:hypothetical protein